MYDGIIAKCIAHPQVSEDGKYLLEQYAANLRETIHNSNTPMALVNVALCKEIYEEYPEVLDGVFETVEARRHCRPGHGGAVVCAAGCYRH